jgi:hypothetical protein
MEVNRFTKIVRIFEAEGFAETPLTAREIDQLIAWDWNDEDIRALGIEMHTWGMKFRDALAYYPG